MSKLITSSHVLPAGSTYQNYSHRDQKVEVSVKFKLDENFLPNKSSMDKFAEFATKNGFSSINNGLSAVVNYDHATVHLTGTVAALESFFQVTLHEYSRKEGGTFRHFDEHLSVPDEFDEEVVGVLGLSTSFKARSYHHVNQSHSTSYYPEEVAKLYNFPAGDGSGQTVGIIELGGGYDVDSLNAYMMNRGLPLPNIVSVNVDGGKNDTSDKESSGEVCLDIDVIASIAPKAKIVVYFCPNTDKGFSDSIAFAINDKVNQPKVISISWGSGENQYSKQALNVFEQDFAKAASLGVNVYVAAGDSGSNDNERSPVTDYPSSSPNTIACGGTRIISASPLKEVVWNDGSNGGATGGGVSKIFAAPKWQTGKFRNTPDVASVASPLSGFNVNINGTNGVVGGTSSSSPLYSALNLLLNENLGRNIGWINPIFYKHGATFNDITQGNNGHYSAKAGLDNCTGLGTPNGQKLLDAVK